ncbi:hypothetical protein KBA73_03730 [Patescibacteria group bacterium]|nr:hypothetical protein [Patescibacteria group bacterium]
MECPECKKGQLHVITMMACSCGHHSLICGGCGGFFSVECGEPYGRTKLPPEHPITCNQGQSERMKQAITASGGTFEDELKKIVQDLPLVEAFRDSLLAAAATDPT